MVLQLLEEIEKMALKAKNYVRVSRIEKYDVLDINQEKYSEVIVISVDYKDYEIDLSKHKDNIHEILDKVNDIESLMYSRVCEKVHARFMKLFNRHKSEIISRWNPTFDSIIFFDEITNKRYTVCPIYITKIQYNGEIYESTYFNLEINQEDFKPLD